MLASSCLVTSTPEFDDPVQTAPEIVGETAEPDLREILTVEIPSRVDFTADIRSVEDVGQNVKYRLLLDYGVLTVNDEPYQDIVAQGEEVLVTADEQRRVSARWSPQNLALGCHTITLVVSHAFDESLPGCPERLEDSSQVTWLVNVCAAGDCGTLDTSTCPVVEAECPIIADERPGEGGGAP